MKLTKAWIDLENSEVRKNLRPYNIAKAEEAQAVDVLLDSVGTIEITLLNDEDEVMGGVTATISWRKMYVNFLWVHESLRGQDKGSELLAKAEEVAREHKCRYVTLDTFSFQAPGFYKKMGYTVYGVLEDSPYDGATQYFLKKSLR
ncbi:GNAT family N-acetyltransferase [Gorillibacterium massiliense]|uniref:GNAT family N-acetyltransferase n=1 Tax=Gorillibacterium massiliense TaxID=1280390 RepID=UPI0004B013E5|nr:GNAT family N-acetyltransferase [Gorillibacterium massiliense]